MKLIFHLSAFFYLVIATMACKSDNSNQASTEDSVTELKSISNDKVPYLYNYYIENPQSLEQKEENQIIDYLVETEQDFERLPTGLYMKIIQQGTGPNYVDGQSCSAHYNGYFLDGKIFDSSYQRNEPINFSIGQMNASWNMSLKMVNPGTEYKIIAPSRFAYGERGFPGYVPPNTIIAFDVKTLQ